MNRFLVRPENRPIVVGHRGASLRAPENTMAAFRRAVADGADAIELDARLTGDGEVVVFHDERLGRTAEGKGRIGGMTCRELRRLSAGRWFHEKFSSEKIPLLAEVLDELGDRTGVNIELKARIPAEERMLPDRTMAVLRNAGNPASILVTSFVHSCIRRIRAAGADLTCGLLLPPYRAVVMNPAALRKAFGVDYLVVNGSALKKTAVVRCHEKGLCVGEYTVNTPRRLQRALRYGVDAVFTDDPAVVGGFLKKTNPGSRPGLLWGNP
ncbi:MAG TPA: glycerophosphodiester phosphodiesterase family protein [Bacteroidota bacterium]|nr:glycerophosphodiester phosphodiesterase family protein [Bacteroidota bacterium]